MRRATIALLALTIYATVSASVTDRADTVAAYAHTYAMPANGTAVTAVVDSIDTTDNIGGNGVIDSVGCAAYRFGWRQLAVPGSLMAVGGVGAACGWFQGLNDVKPHGSPKPHSYVLDDLVQYTPLVGIYGLKLCGVHSRHGYGGTTVLMAMSFALSAGTVQIVKHTVHRWRPDGSEDDSFPSGHTATAFMAAELMRYEFSDCPWIGAAAYTVAVGTAALRVAHNRHWLTDALAGAGIGILATHTAYWLYPWVTRTLFPRLYSRDLCIAPFVAPGGAALSMSMAF